MIGEIAPNGKKVVIIGAGVSGLASACQLAKQGFEVTILEKNSAVGGRAGVWEEQGFRFDMGPSWYWMPTIFDEFFADFGHKTSDFYELRKLDPQYQIFFRQDEKLANLCLPGEEKEIIELFENHEKGSGQKLQSLLKYAKICHDLGLEFMKKPSLSWREFLPFFFNWRFLWLFLQLNLSGLIFGKLHKKIDKVSQIPIFRQMLFFPILFLGLSQAQTPNFYSLLIWTNFAEGTYYPMGGITKFIEALQTLAENLGVKIITNSSVVAVELAKLAEPTENMITENMAQERQEKNWRQNQTDKTQKYQAQNSQAQILGVWAETSS